MPQIDPTLAAVWDEGHRAGEGDATAPPNKYPTPNPYLSDVENEARKEAHVAALQRSGYPASTF